MNKVLVSWVSLEIHSEEGQRRSCSMVKIIDCSMLGNRSLQCVTLYVV
jgi:hypothetical protein